MESVLEQLGLAGAEVRRASPNWAENLVRFLTHPIVSSLLITVGMLGIYPGNPHARLRRAGRARYREPGAFLLGPLAGAARGLGRDAAGGVRCCASGLEIFVIPGFGLAGVLGIGALLAGLSLSLDRRRRHMGVHRSKRWGE